MECGELVAIQVEPQLLSFIRPALQSSRVCEFQKTSDLEKIIPYLQKNRNRVHAVLLGAKTEDPVQMAQRLRTIDKELRIVILVTADRSSDVQRAFQFAPFLGRHVECIVDGDKPVVAETVQKVMQKARRQREYSQVLSSLSLPSLQEAGQRPLLTNFFERLPDFAPIGLAALDPSGRILAWNRKATVLIGLTEREVLGSPFEFFFDEREWSCLREIISGARPVNEETPLVVERRLSSGQTQWFEIIFGPLNLHESEPGWMVLFQDITAYKEIEAQLRESKIAAESANRAKSQFLANMSHEIRTPLGAVLGFAELLADPTQSVSDREMSIAAVRRNSRQLTTLIDEILDLSKIEAGHLEIERGDLEVASLWADILPSLDLRAGEKGLKLQVKARGPTPQRIHSDQARLRQILLNVIGNAIKFSERGAVEVVMSMESDGPEPQLVFRVNDMGPGLTPEQASVLFEPFRQADNSLTRKHGGTGLGLALSRRLARALGGDLVLESSQPGTGSTFKITISTGPIDEKNLLGIAETRISNAPQPSSAGDFDLKGLSILLVEDSPDNQVLISRFLRKAGAEVTLAGDGLQGIRKALAEDFDLVLMDIQMPVLNGYEAVEALRSRGYPKPIIALTAHAMKEERDKCLALGFTAHLSKPIQRQVLLSAILDLGRSAKEKSP